MGYFWLSNQLVDNVSVDGGEAEIEAFVAVGELFVVDAEEVKNGGVKVVDVERVGSGGESEIICLPVVGTGVDAAPCHPECPTFGMMISARAALRHRGATKLATPDNQCIF